jgi:hypothetical protein
MAFDVCARRARSKAGKCFQVNSWTWRPILALMARLCPDLIGQELLASMSANEGRGLAARRHAPRSLSG